jgi:membrane-bound lytic murein transglycosylase D
MVLVAGPERAHGEETQLREVQVVDTGGLSPEELASLGLSPPASLPLRVPKGRKPTTPAATLPEGVPHPAPLANSRLGIREQVAGAIPAPLKALELAERALFPEHAVGLKSGLDAVELGTEVEGPRAVLGLPGTLVPRSVGVAEDDLKWLSGLTLPDLPVRLDRRVVTYLKFYRDSPRGRTIAAIWAKKSGRYAPAIQAELRRAGLPTDLVWLSLVESSHEPTITSGAGAVGLWQFLPDSARMYGLTVDAWVDERRDPIQSTKAAIRFLSDLYARFQSWELAMAAYNMGYAGLSRTIGKFNTNNYWLLSRLEGGLPWETTLYVPKIYAIGIVLNNREAFGLSRMTPDPSIEFDTIWVEPLTQLTQVAKLGQVSVEALLSLNPALIQDRTPPAAAPSQLRVPRGTGQKIVSGLRPNPKPRTVRVRLGDSSRTVAARFGVSEQSLLQFNRIPADRFAPGTVLLLPSDASLTPQDPLPPVVVTHHAVAPGPGERLVFYEVQTGDDIPKIAWEFQVSESSLLRDNGLDAEALLRPGMFLQILVAERAGLSDVRFFEGADVHALIAGSAEFHQYYEGLRGYERIVVTAQPGDTLVSIGRKYGVSGGSMERINRRSQTTPLVAGEPVIVYTDRARGALAPPDEPLPLPPIVAPAPERLPHFSASSSSLPPP